MSNLAPTCLVSPAQAATLVGMSRASIYRWVRSGRLPAHRVGDAARGPLRIRTADLAAQLRRIPMTESSNGTGVPGQMPAWP